MELKDLAYDGEENGSKKGLFEYVCPFDIEFDEATQVATIVSAGKDIYLVDTTARDNGTLEMTFGFDRKGKEMTFKSWIGDPYGKENPGREKAVGISLIKITEAFLARSLDLAGKDNFQYNNFEELWRGLLGKIEPRTSKVFMCLGFKQDEAQYINFEMINGKNDEGKFLPSISAVESEISIEALPFPSMKLISLDEDEVTEPQEPISDEVVSDELDLSSVM